MFYCQCCIVYCFAIYAGLIIPSLLCVDLSLNEKFPNKQLKKVRHSTIIVVNLSMSLKLTGSIMHVYEYDIIINLYGSNGGLLLNGPAISYSNLIYSCTQLKEM